MGIPATSGVLRANLAEMQIGDYIPCTYIASTSGAVGTFSNLGVNSGTEIPVAGSATPNGLFYFIKVDRGLLIADRVVQHSISWDTLNAGQFIEGRKLSLGQEVLIRSLSGGCAYADASGNMSLTDKSLGTFPINNEWDKYIINDDLGGKITKGDDNVWHMSYSNGYSISWVKETTINGMSLNGVASSNANRIIRNGNIFTYGLSNATGTYIGFRPALEYLEPNAKATTLFC